MKIMNIIPLNTEPAVKLCRDCKWCSPKGEHSRCRVPSNPRNQANEAESRALALVDPALKAAPEYPFCVLERQFSGEGYCTAAGRWWEPKQTQAAE